jgi:hypothetical protein
VNAAVALLLSAGVEALAMQDTDIPVEAFDDWVMAGADEIKAMQDWAASLGSGAERPLPFKSEPPSSFVHDGRPSD